MTDVPERRAGRVLVLDERDRMLLFRFRDPGATADHLASPGGRVEGDETDEQAVRREVAEELGLLDVELGPPIWDRVSGFDLLGTWTRALERCFLLRIRSDALGPHDGHLAVENVLDRGWWTLDEIARSDEAIWPSELATLVRDLLRDGVPSQPIRIGA